MDGNLRPELKGWVGRFCKGASEVVKSMYTKIRGIVVHYDDGSISVGSNQKGSYFPTYYDPKATMNPRDLRNNLWQTLDAYVKNNGKCILDLKKEADSCHPEKRMKCTNIFYNFKD